jgi:hypothetical protein
MKNELLNFRKSWKALFSNFVARGGRSNNARKKLENNHINAAKRLLPYVNNNIKGSTNYYPYLGKRGLNKNTARNATRAKEYYTQQRKKFHNNLSKAFIIHTKAKQNNKNRPFGFPNQFPMNALVRSLASLHRK